MRISNEDLLIQLARLEDMHYNRVLEQHTRAIKFLKTHNIPCCTKPSNTYNLPAPDSELYYRLLFEAIYRELL